VCPFEELRSDEVRGPESRQPQMAGEIAKAQSVACQHLLVGRREMLDEYCKAPTYAQQLPVQTHHVLLARRTRI
jgi:hypothetical protein